MTESPASKDALRREARQRLLDMSPELMQSSSQTLCRRLASLSAFESAPAVAGFWPRPSEPDIRPFLVGLAAEGTPVLLPVVTKFSRFHTGKPRLHLARFEAENLLRSNRWGILEPSGEPVEPPPGTVVLVPALAVTRKGDRIGNGFGYYDELLASLRDPFAVGVVFRQQVFTILPTQPHDVRLSGVVTPDGVFETS